MFFEVVHTDANSRARVGRIETPHGAVETPAYVIVGTYGSVQCIEDPEDLKKTKTQIVIANAYHLWRSLGEEELNNYPGLHAVMGWNGPLMTDSGGFQVFSLGFLREHGLRRGRKRSGKSATKDDTGKTGNPNSSENLVRITEAGVYFRAEGEREREQYLDAELSIRIQEQLGADIIVAFDEPTSPAASREYSRSAMDRTHQWAERSLEAKTSRQAIYGVVQGGAFEDLRKESARFIGTMPFDGFAIGSTYGDSYGGTKAKTAEMLEWSVPLLPREKPAHLFGVGRIEDIFAGVAAGIDTFDCVIPTREARHGALYTVSGRIDIIRGKYATDEGVIDEACGCPVCFQNPVERRELYALFKEKNPEAGRLATIHNVYFVNDLMEKIRDAIRSDTLGELRKRFLRAEAAPGSDSTRGSD